MNFFGDGSFVHPTQNDSATAVVPPAEFRQIHRTLDNYHQRPTHRRSYSDVQVVLKRSVSSSSSTRLTERPSPSLGHRDKQTTATNPSVVKIPLSHYKTEFCTKFREFGQCPFEARCRFVHNENELQRRGRPLTYKTQPCWSGSSCQYQMNHSRCVYLHGDETAEMFDDQRGISFERVQNILAAKEAKQQQRRQQQQSLQQSQLQSRLQRRSSLLEQSSFAESFEGVSSQEGGSGMNNDMWVVESKGANAYESHNTSAAVIAPRQQKTLQRSLTYPRSTPNRKSLAIVPPSPPLLRNNSNNKSENDKVASTATMTTRHPLADLFSPGVMPVIETPFPSHDRIHEWKDSCFEDEDRGVDIEGTVIRGASSSSSLYRPPDAVPPSTLLSSMMERFGTMGFFSGTFPTDELIPSANNLQSHARTQQGVVASNSLVHTMDPFTFQPL
ncbi:hypothetical protein BGZ97_006414 [Linnemannia gamsii]|uniref:C3H1-type domain-containing protein n=1 Tax=Linnemannia gamsii TaxID=64522 RepID=A0A9P6US11_9FUNG|nr:hypothetical protein BGZ97_006414 [Linnemannia gamsii]